MEALHISVPATVSNLGPGFDCLSLAVSIRNETVFEPAGSFSTVIEGEGAGLLPEDESNPIIEAYIGACLARGKEPQPVRVTCRNRVPLGMGLGSSAAAAVTGIAAAHAMLGRKMDEDAVLDEAARLEGHPDNAAAALLGGLVASRQEDGKAEAVKLEVSRRIGISILLPDEALPTYESRKALPKAVALGDAAANIAAAVMLVKALATGDIPALAAATEDRMHQPYRLPLSPQAEEAYRTLRRAGLASGLCGAGPSLFVLHEKGHVPAQAEKAARNTGMRLRTPDVERRGLSFNLSR